MESLWRLGVDDAVNWLRNIVNGMLLQTRLRIASLRQGHGTIPEACRLRGLATLAVVSNSLAPPPRVLGHRVPLCDVSYRQKRDSRNARSVGGV